MAGDKKLTAKQKLFVEHYLATDNAYQSALAAGYAESTARAKSYQWLEKPEIAKHIRRRQKELLRKAIEPEKLVAALASIVNADIADFVTYEAGMLVPKATAEIPKSKRAAITGIKCGAHGIEMQFANKLRAMELMFKITGLYDDGLLLDGPASTENPFEGMTTDELRKLVGKDGGG